MSAGGCFLHAMASTFDQVEVHASALWLLRLLPVALLPMASGTGEQYWKPENLPTNLSTLAMSNDDLALFARLGLPRGDNRLSGIAYLGLSNLIDNRGERDRLLFSPQVEQFVEMWAEDMELQRLCWTVLHWRKAHHFQGVQPVHDVKASNNVNKVLFLYATRSAGWCLTLVSYHATACADIGYVGTAQEGSEDALTGWRDFMVHYKSFLKGLSIVSMVRTWRRALNLLLLAAFYWAGNLTALQIEFGALVARALDVRVRLPIGYCGTREHITAIVRTARPAMITIQGEMPAAACVQGQGFADSWRLFRAAGATAAEDHAGPFTLAVLIACAYCSILPSPCANSDQCPRIDRRAKVAVRVSSIAMQCSFHKQRVASIQAQRLRRSQRARQQLRAAAVCAEHLEFVGPSGCAANGKR
jgi:hypothetical protein